MEDPSPLEVAVLRRLGLGLEARPVIGSLVREVLASGGPRWGKLAGFRLDPGTAELVRRSGGGGDRSGLLRRLLGAHDEAVSRALASTEPPVPASDPTEAGPVPEPTVLDLKRKVLSLLGRDCRLCGLACGGTLPGCPARAGARYLQHYVHVGEEAEIGRTLVLELMGCNLWCRFCHKGDTLVEPGSGGDALGPSVWTEVSSYPAGAFGSLSFLGGNPDQSLDGVLAILSCAPPAARGWPVVWHTNGYSRPVLYDLLWGVVDVWVYDFKFFSDRCAVSLTRAADYVRTAKEGLEAVCGRDASVPVIVRHLLLPGHESCCLEPLLRYLAERYRDRVLFNPMGQYVPSWRVGPGDGALSLPLPAGAAERARRRARRMGLRLAG
ncbi:MAG: hypothetical protein K6U08_00650 [Firmicutes bacterium]|nr:hypothetical protein [Bacillota bacterium]